MKDRLGKIIVAYTYDGKPVTAKDVKAVGSMAVLLKDAMKPNRFRHWNIHRRWFTEDLLQTLHMDVIP